MTGNQETRNPPRNSKCSGFACGSPVPRRRAERFGLSPQTFAGALEEVARQYLAATASPSEVCDFLGRLRVENLRPAAAPWGARLPGDFLDSLSRKAVWRGTLAVPGHANARELADSLYADLYRHADGGGPGANLEAELVYRPRLLEGSAPGPCWRRST